MMRRGPSSQFQHPPPPQISKYARLNAELGRWLRWVRSRPAKALPAKGAPLPQSNNTRKASVKRVRAHPGKNRTTRRDSNIVLRLPLKFRASILSYLCLVDHFSLHGVSKGFTDLVSEKFAHIRHIHSDFAASAALSLAKALPNLESVNFLATEVDHQTIATFLNRCKQLQSFGSFRFGPVPFSTELLYGPHCQTPHVRSEPMYPPPDPSPIGNLSTGALMAGLGSCPYKRYDVEAAASLSLSNPNDLRILRYEVYFNRNYESRGDHGWIYEVASQLPTVRLLDLAFTGNSIVSQTAGDFNVLVESLATLGNLRGIEGFLCRYRLPSLELLQPTFTSFPQLRALHVFFAYRKDRFANILTTMTLPRRLEVLCLAGRFPTGEEVADVDSVLQGLLMDSQKASAALAHLVLASNHPASMYNADALHDDNWQVKCYCCGDRACAFVPREAGGRMHRVIDAVEEFVCGDSGVREEQAMMYDPRGRHFLQPRRRGDKLRKVPCSWCGQSVTEELLEDHTENVCEHRVRRCPLVLSGCRFRTRSPTDVVAHMGVCPLYEVVCLERKCLATVLRGELQKHVEEVHRAYVTDNAKKVMTPQVPVSCPRCRVRVLPAEEKTLDDCNDHQPTSFMDALFLVNRFRRTRVFFLRQSNEYACKDDPECEMGVVRRGNAVMEAAELASGSFFPRELTSIVFDYSSEMAPKKLSIGNFRRSAHGLR